MRFVDLLHFLKQIFLPNRKPTDQCANIEQDEEANIEEWTRWDLLREKIWKKLHSGELTGILVSILIHILVLFLFSMIFMPALRKSQGIDILGGFNLPKDDTETSLTLEPGGADEGKDNKNDTQSKPDTTSEQSKSSTPVEKPAEASVAGKIAFPILDPDFKIPVEGGEGPPVNGNAADSNQFGNFVSGGGFENRTRQGRDRAVGSGDACAPGEDAVEAALAWLAKHQIKTGDLKGAWSFDFEESCKCCSDGGPHPSRTASTALALLAFLGAGYTHENALPGEPTNRYKQVVEDGLAFLIVRARTSEEWGCDLQYIGKDGMYSHGIAAMCLCEANAMSRRKPKRLNFVAQESIRFIERAQDVRTGGWRYKPNESPGDLSVSAWQIMALKSARLGGLHVSQPTIYGAWDFLDRVQDDGGRRYHYLPQLIRPGIQGKGKDSIVCCNAMGLLLRMYLGWKPGEAVLDEGIDMIARRGPLNDDGSSCNLYFAYYSTLAMHHYGGSNWNSWNRQVREFLIQTQAQRGHEAGSWYFEDYYCDKGGRLLNTVLATLILETPYRIMPLFRRR